MEVQAIGGTRASSRSRRPVHGDLVHQAPCRGRITPLMGRTGPALDNAMAESFIATLMTELLVHRRRFPDPEVASSVIFEYLEGLYNGCRSHSALNYRSAADYEEATMDVAAVA
jgi:transposase InsO family protein